MRDVSDAVAAADQIYALQTTDAEFATQATALNAVFTSCASLEEHRTLAETIVRSCPGLVRAMTDVVVEGDDLVHLATRLLLNLSYNADGLAVMKALGLCDILLAVLPVLPDVALVFALQLAGRLLPTCSDLPISNQNRWLHAATARLATAIQTAEDEADDAVAALSVLAEPLLQLVDHLLSPGSSDINKHVSQVLRRTDCVLGRQHPAAALLSRVQRRLGAATISAN